MEDQNSYARLLTLFESVQDNPEKAQLIAETVAIIASRLSKCKEILQEFPNQTKAKFLNCLCQEDFSYFMNRIIYQLNKECVDLIDNDKLQRWVSQIPIHRLLQHVSIALWEKLIANNLIPIDTIDGEPGFIQVFLEGSNTYAGRENIQSKYYLKIFEFALFHAKCEIDPKLLEDKHSRVLEIVSKFYINKCHMLQLECQTKDSHIQDFLKKK
jgi:hypothetical protein